MYVQTEGCCITCYCSLTFLSYFILLIAYKNSLNNRSFREITVSSPQSKAQTKNKLKHEQEIENSLEKPSEKSSVNNKLWLLLLIVTVTKESYSSCVDVKHPRNMWLSFLKYLQRIMNLAEIGGKKGFHSHIDYRTIFFFRDIIQSAKIRLRFLFVVTHSLIQIF